ncbi:MAG: MFS transporter [Planctomycetes bacterium]|nr:MFS transporter [Planctomycetota bacterium]MBI3847862.1 MFS transporter [Planctomycetota bacterium]
MPPALPAADSPQRTDRPLIRSLVPARFGRLPFFARYTFRRHARAEVLQGVYQALFDLRAVVARKAFGASDVEVSLIASFPTIAQSFAMTWRTLLRRVDRRRALVAVGLAGKGLYLLVALATHSWLFVALACAAALVDCAYIPLRNLLYQSNYPEKLRGLLFSTGFSIMIAANLAMALTATTCLDHWGTAYRWLYPLAALAGIGAHVVYARTRLRGAARAPRPTAPRGSRMRHLVAAVRHPIHLTRSILRRDSRFRALESGFVLYGITYLMNDVLVVFVAVDELAASYKQVSIALTVIPFATMILCFPLWGRFLDRADAMRVATLAFLAVGVWTIALTLTHSIAMLYATGFLKGVAMAGINVVWNLGPLRLAPRGKASDYMSVHVTLVGVRGLAGPPIILFFRTLFGVHVALAVGAAFALAASLVAMRGPAAPRPASPLNGGS